MDAPNSLNSISFVAIFAASGSILFLAMHAHKRLFSDFLAKLELQIGDSQGGHGAAERDDEGKKKKKKATGKGCRNGGDEESLEAMPLNWQVMYKGRLQYRKLIRGGCN